MPKIKVAVLDDYQEVALKMADWSPVQQRADVTVFHDHVSDLDTLAARLSPFDVVCVMRERTPMNQPLFDRLPNLKLIVSTAMRNASIDLDAARKKGVTVCGTTYVGHGAAELTWALILAATKNITEESASLRSGAWQKTIGGDLKGRTLGILGLGRLGASIAKFGHAFDMNVIAWSTNLTQSKADEHNVRLVTKQQLFAESDIVSVHLVLSDRTIGLVGRAELALMKPSALFVNTARGPIVDEQALIEALTARKIAGAALDVFDTEPLPAAHPFRLLENVLATPHIGYVTQDTYRLFYRDTVEAVLAWLDGKPVRTMN